MYFFNIILRFSNFDIVSRFTSWLINTLVIKYYINMAIKRHFYVFSYFYDYDLSLLDNSF